MNRGDWIIYAPPWAIALLSIGTTTVIASAIVALVWFATALHHCAFP